MHIDASLQRVTINVASLPDDIWRSPRGALRAMLHTGEYRPDLFDDTNSGIEIGLSVVVAHEQRHAVDYHLTNAGARQTRYWTQLKLASAAKIGEVRTIPVHLAIDSWRIGEGLVPPPTPGERDLAQVAALNAAFVARDRELRVPNIGVVDAGRQLEALATVFEVAHLEEAHGPEAVSLAVGHIPRDLERWRRDYVWPIRLFETAGLGPVSAEREELIAFTRTWPVFLVAALMGPTSWLTSERLAAEPETLESVLPSRRLIRLLAWAREQRLSPDFEPADLWPLIDTAAGKLFGQTVLESLDADVGWLAGVVDDLERSPAQDEYEQHFRSDLRFQLSQRQRAAALLHEYPMALLDPLDANRYLAHRQFVPDFSFLDRAGFDPATIPAELEPQAFRLGDIDGRPTQLRPVVPASIRGSSAYDEIWTQTARFLITGLNSTHWLGPEAEALARVFNERGATIHPPWNKLPSGSLRATG